jgi:hypothetical protein
MSGLLPASAGARLVCGGLVVVLGLLAAGGCRGPGRRQVVPVRGEVFVESKGKRQPAKGAEVFFHIQNDDLGFNPKGTVEEDGSFQVSTDGPNDGLPVGKYKVTITWHKTKVLMGQKERVGPDLLQGKYKDPNKTPLRATVTSEGLDPKTFKLDLQAAPGG